MPDSTKSIQENDPSKINVMLVDDSAVIRGFMTRILDKEPYINIVASLSNGEMAVNAIERKTPDVIVLDIEMPVMDGITAIPLLLAKKPATKILICSSLSAKGADISMKALALGATECLVKPSTSSEMAGAGEFQKQLLALIRNLCPNKVANNQSPLNPGTSTSASASSSTAAAASQSAATAARPAPYGSSFQLRNDRTAYHCKPEIIAIGSSTGGPQALFAVLKHFKNLSVPTVITQHMPKTFTTMLAQHIGKNTGLPCHEGAENMKLEAGHIYVAPGGYHMTFERKDNATYIRLNDGPPENFCKPSVDPMIRSLLSIYGNKILEVMLTGMGNDGLPSARTLVENGSRLIAQDEATSIVWGMPGAVATNNLCSAVLPLDEIGPWVVKQIATP